MNFAEKFKKRNILKQTSTAEKLLNQFRSQIGEKKYGDAMKLLKQAKLGVNDETKIKEKTDKKPTESNK